MGFAVDDLYALLIARDTPPAAAARALRSQLTLPLVALRGAMARGEPVHVAPVGNHNGYEDELVRLLNVCDALEGAGVRYELRALDRDPADDAPGATGWRDAERTSRARIEDVLRQWREIGAQRTLEDERKAAARRGPVVGDRDAWDAVGNGGAVEPDV